VPEANLRTRLREYREALGLTQERLAEIVGVRRETIIYLERGKYNPSLRLAYQVARAVGRRIEDVFIFDED
jgi:putative transcriptional regulator